MGCGSYIARCRCYIYCAGGKREEQGARSGGKLKDGGCVHIMYEGSGGGVRRVRKGGGRESRRRAAVIVV